MYANICGPVRPNAIATLLTTDDFLPGVQTLLHSLKETLPSAPFPADYHEPELIVMITPNISEKVRFVLHPAFCTRLIEVDPIPIPSTSAGTPDESGSDVNMNSSSVDSWRECGYSKLHIFGQKVYNKILYIDSDCLVRKDISQLFQLENESSRGLIAAAPDIFPPDNFNAGVMLIRPSDDLFNDLSSKTESLVTYDGGDTGFLNAYFDDWHSYPSEGRLGFQYNAQRFMHQCTYNKQPKYWDLAVGEISIIHYSSTPKPWQSDFVGKKPEPSSQSNFLPKEEIEKIALHESKSKALDKLWNKCYRKSIIFKEEFEENEKLKKKQKVIKKKKPAPTKAAPPKPSQGAAKKKKASLDFNRRFKQLRKEGLNSKEAMKKARNEFGYDKNDKISAGKQVAQMFGMPL